MMAEQAEELDEAQRRRLTYAAAIQLLSYRDHSVFELKSKLLKRENSVEIIECVIRELLDANYLNDKRYAEYFTEQLSAKGYGPLAISAKLRDRGLESHLIQDALSRLDLDWSEQVEHLIHKRFNSADIISKDQKATARIARFVMSRGFTSRDAVRGLHGARDSILTNTNPED